MHALQELIHKLEVGGGMRYFRWVLGVLVLALFVIGYNARAFKNMSTQEAMDGAQLARNIARGKGYTTFFVRPFSMHLVKQRTLEKHGPSAPDPARIKGNHPDLANPPLYPYLLAGLMKVRKFDYAASSTKPFWSSDGRFWRYQPDFLISGFNQILLLLIVVLSYFLARRLFDPTVAWLSAALILGTELFWRFCVSGLSTVLLMLIFLGLAWSLALLEQEAREPRRGLGWLLLLAVAAGLLTGLGGLTRYAFGFVILPVLLFLALFGGQRRIVLALVAFLVFAGIMTPWVTRNYSVSGTPFGTSGYSLFETSGSASSNRLERSLEPDTSKLSARLIWYKLAGNARPILLNDLPKLGGNWLAAFFLVGLLLGFRDPSATRLRYFLASSLVVLTLVQALGRTHLSEDSPEINSENLLVLVAPIILIYGTSLFLLLLEQIELPFRELRHVAIGAFVLLCSLPLVLIFLPPRGIPIAYPPYYPPALQVTADWTKDDELTMSDIPWAMAWYGERQCVWLSSNAGSDFFAINDYQKPVQALYLSRQLLDSPFSDWVHQGGEQGWGNFVLQCALRANQHQPPVPPSFPLHYWQAGWPDLFLLTAREHSPKER